MLLTALLLVATPSVLGFRSPRLHVTPYLQRGDIRQARELSLVTGLTPNITSYSGFITVDEKAESNLFFWFFPSQNDWLKDPVTLWLNGGPGKTSMFGLLVENGPYELLVDGKLRLREHSWNRNSSIIYIDNPVGTGYSYTNRNIYVRSSEYIGGNLTVGLIQFFQLFPEISHNPFYMFGEGYAGKFIVAAGLKILESGSTINLQGLAVGDGFIDPINQLNFADYLYQLGLVDNSTADGLRNSQEFIVVTIERGPDAITHVLWNFMFDAITEATGITVPHNYLLEAGSPEPYVDFFMSHPDTREALHVGSTIWQHGENTLSSLELDLFQSVKPALEVLMEKYRVLLYNGQLDIICGYPMSVDYIRQLNWTGSEEYLHAKRKIWMVEDRVAGYSKTVGNFTEVLVRNAGHMVPTDQPAWALDLYNKFIFNQPF